MRTRAALGVQRLADSPSIRTAFTGYTVLALNVLTGIVSARLLSVDGRGALAIVQMWPTLGAYLMDIGVTPALMYFTAKQRSLIVINMFFARSLLLVSTLGYIVGAIGLLVVNATHPDLFYASLLMVIIFIPLNAGMRMTLAALQGLQRYGEMNVGRILAATSTLVWLTPLVLLPQKWRLLGAMAAILLGQALQLLWNARCLGHLKSSDNGSMSNGLALRDLLRYGARAHLGGLSPVDGVHIDMQVVAGFLTKYDAGIYAVSSSIGGLVRNLGASFGAVAGPRAAWGRSEPPSRQEFLRSFLIVGSLSFGLAAVMWVGVLPWAVPLAYGAAFDVAVPYAQSMLLVGVLGGLRQLTADSLRGMGAPGKASLAEVVSLAVAGAALPLGAHNFGLIGVIMGVAFAYLVSLLVQITSIWRLASRS